jgi:hypothetical protein
MHSSVLVPIPARAATLADSPKRSGLACDFVWCNARFLCCSCFVVLLASEALGVVKGDVQLLKLVADENQANREAIRTWRGRASITENDKRRDGSTFRLESSVEFAYDSHKAATRWYNLNRSQVSKAGDPSGSHDERTFSSGMVKDKAFYSLGPLAVSAEGTRKATVADPKRAGRGVMSNDFAPVIFLNMNNLPVSRELLFFFEHAQDPNISEYFVRREGDRVIFEGRLEDLWHRYEFDLSKGGNIILHESKSKMGSTVRKQEYTEISGVWVPSRMTYENKRSEEGRTYSRTIEWLENEVNSPLADNEFSLAKLGLRKGDHIRDLRSGARLEIFGGDLPAAAGLAEVAPRPARWGLRVIGMAASGALLILLVTMIVKYQSSRRSKSP